MEALELLQEQHREVEELFATLAEADPSDRRGIFDDLADALLAHATAEERHFYPAVKAAQTEDLLLESLEEHLEIKRAIAELLRGGAREDDESFLAKVGELEDLVDDHVAEEESELFPMVRQLFSTEQLEELGEAMQATYDEVATGDHAAQPSATF